MTLSVLHTGQTGVERGAARAARTLGIKIEGFCAHGARDELGALPPEVSADLIACDQRGARSALRATVQIANALVIAVPDVSLVNTNAGVEALRRTARVSGVPHWVIDPTTDLDRLSGRLRELERTSDPLRLMVTGPRFTRWHDGERLGWRVIAQLSLTPRKHRVLVVDDHRETAENVCTLLSTLGHDAVLAENGTTALALAQQFDPDVALLDIDLPDISGYELARRLRSAQSHPLFLAAVTGWAQGRDSAPALAAGFDRHVLKPTTADMIRSILEQASQSTALVP